MPITDYYLRGTNSADNYPTQAPSAYLPQLGTGQNALTVDYGAATTAGVATPEVSSDVTGGQYVGAKLGPNVGASIEQAYQEATRYLNASIKKRTAVRDLNNVDITSKQVRRDQGIAFDRNSERVLTPFLQRGLRQSGITDVGRARFFQDRANQVSDTEVAYRRARSQILEQLAQNEIQDLIDRSLGARSVLPSQQQIDALFSTGQ
jgi:hypothetical protein